MVVVYNISLILFRLRHEIRQLLDDGIEPIHVAVGNEALYHSLSMCLFGKPNYWVHLKLGNLMYGIANEPKIVEKVLDDLCVEFYIYCQV